MGGPADHGGGAAGVPQQPDPLASGVVWIEAWGHRGGRQKGTKNLDRILAINRPSLFLVYR